MMRININRVPFSVPGTYFSVNEFDRSAWSWVEPGLVLRSNRAHEADSVGVIGYISLIDGDGATIPYDAYVMPGELTLTSGQAEGTVRITFDDSGAIRITGRGLGLQLTSAPGRFSEVLRISGRSWYASARSFDCKYLFTEASEQVDCARSESGVTIRFFGKNWEARISEHRGAVEPDKAALDEFEPLAKQRAKEFRDFCDIVVQGIPDKYKKAAELAAYVNWSSEVGPGGNYCDRVMLMSKNWMNSVWAWDCAFNAVELSHYDPDGAWANLACPFHHQGESGLLPDTVSEHVITTAYTKPPIHGWAIRRLREAGVLRGDRLGETYRMLARLVEGWLRTMDWDGDGICQYLHGNDSGWDNCSAIGWGRAVEAPDLSAYLVVCMDELADEAEELGLIAESEHWRERSDALLSAFLTHSWDGERFRVLENGTHGEIENADSLLPFLPLILGNRLPKGIFEKLAAGLKEENRFLTPHGLATESVSSPYYKPDGYWLGPIWAPPTMLIADGLRSGGECNLAKEIARRFCDTCASSGFAENFNAVTGAPLRDPAYTWTSSVFLTLAREFVSEDDNEFPHDLTE